MLYFCRLQDRKNYILARAPRLPFTHINEADDVWLSGEIRCEEPVVTPYFDLPSLHYSYTYEVEERDSDGDRDWKTKARESDSAYFYLHDDEGNEILVLGKDAEFHDLQKEQYYPTNHTRHTVYYFPHLGAASVMGLVGEKKETLGTTSTIPLVVVSCSPEEHLERESDKEENLRTAGFIIMWIAFTMWILLFSVALGQSYEPYDLSSYVRALLGPAILALLPTAGLFFISLHNTFVEYRIRTENAWRLVYIDMKNRHDLVHQLQEVIRGMKNYESQTLERVASLRTSVSASYDEGVVQHEQEVHNGVKQMVALKEAYPELKSNELYMQFATTLRALEDKIAHGRSFFNDNAAEYNTIIQKFPHSLLAAILLHKPLKLFDIDD